MTPTTPSTMDEISIRIELAGRVYPLTVNPTEEARIRQAVSEINESIARLKSQYPMTDKQDLLGMAALEVTTRALNMVESRPAPEDPGMQAELDRLLSDLES